MKHTTCSIWKTLRRSGIFITVLFLFLTVASNAQSFSNIKLRVTNVNDFAEGYDRTRHTYDDDFIQRTLINPAARTVEASVAESIPLRSIRMSPVDNDRCSNQMMRLIPASATSFVWTLKRKDIHLNRLVTIMETTQKLKPYSRPAGSKCVPLFPQGTRSVELKDCQLRFSVPIPAAQAVNQAPQYEVQFDILDKNKNVLFSRIEKISVPKDVPLIVSIGDSYASGEGNPDQPGKSKDDNYDIGDVINLKDQRDCEDDATVMIMFKNKPEMKKQPFWFDPRDHRSLRSGPALAAKELLKDWPYVVFLNFAKSGAVISTPQKDNDILEQLEHVQRVVGNHKIDALLISAGGNDLGFSEVLTNMAKDFSDLGGESVVSKFIERTLTLRNEKYPKIPAKIKELNLNVQKVLIAEYPGHVFNNSQGKPSGGCGVFKTLHFLTVSEKDALALERMGNMLNEEVRLAAQRFNWIFVNGISKEFVKHGYCSNEPYYVSASSSCDTQGDFDGMVHPNAKGTLVYARALVRELQKVLPKPDINLQAIATK